MHSLVPIDKDHWLRSCESQIINQVFDHFGVGLQFLMVLDAISIIVIYSMSVDGPARVSIEPGAKQTAPSPGLLAGSRALESLARFITSKELLFHPSQSSVVTRSVRVHLYSMETRLHVV
jgi:hypothetical protein